MIVERWLTSWETLPGRRPLLWRAGAGVLGLVSVATALLQTLVHPRPEVWGSLVLLALLLLVAFGQPVLWNTTEHRLRALWRVVGFIILGGLLGRLASLAHLIPRGRISEEAIASGEVVHATIGRLIVTMVAAILAVRLFDRRPVAQLGVTLTRPFWRDLAFGLFLGALLMTMIFGVERAAGWLTVVGWEQSKVAAVPFSVILQRTALVFLCVGIYEEVTARGYLLRTIAQGMTSRRIGARASLVLATLISSALFGLGHAGNPNATVTSTLTVGVAGALLALPYILTGNLGVSIGMHMTWNFFQGVVYGFPVSGIALPGSVFVIRQGGPAAWTGGPFGPEAGLLGLLAEAVGVGLILLYARLLEGEVRLCTSLADGAPAPTLAEVPPPLQPDAAPLTA